MATADCVNRGKALRIRVPDHVSIENLRSGTQGMYPARGTMALRMRGWDPSFAVVVPCWREVAWRGVASGFEVLSLSDRNH